MIGWNPFHFLDCLAFLYSPFAWPQVYSICSPASSGWNFVDWSRNLGIQQTSLPPVAAWYHLAFQVNLLQYQPLQFWSVSILILTSPTPLLMLFSLLRFQSGQVPHIYTISKKVLIFFPLISSCFIWSNPFRSLAFMGFSWWKSVKPFLPNWWQWTSIKWLNAYVTISSYFDFFVVFPSSFLKKKKSVNTSLEYDQTSLAHWFTITGIDMCFWLVTFIKQSETVFNFVFRLHQIWPFFMEHKMPCQNTPLFGAPESSFFAGFCARIYGSLR